MKFLTPYDIAEILSISYEKALNFVKYSGVEYIHIGRQYRVSEDALKVFLKKHREINIESEV